ncbi:hypothetical protein E4T56_gene4857 [Termitomyces sp. T112]|nr:hypothetical protein E4T56_gene4857 [Termitomyces sp. T112]
MIKFVAGIIMRGSRIVNGVNEDTSAVLQHETHHSSTLFFTANPQPLSMDSGSLIGTKKNFRLPIDLSYF